MANVVPGKKGFVTVPLAERFWAKVGRGDECWTWTASRSRDGGRRQCRACRALRSKESKARSRARTAMSKALGKEE